MSYLDLLSAQFNRHMRLVERRPGIYQLVVPLYHEDGDMIDLFLEEAKDHTGWVRVCDHGMTLMRLSYSLDVDTPSRERILQRILAENGVSEANGNLYLEVQSERLYPAVLQFAQVVAKVSNMEQYRREVVHHMFYDLLYQFVEESLTAYHPRKSTFPLAKRDDLEVDVQFDIGPHPIYLFGVRGDAKARLAAISCLEFERENLAFRSFIVHDDFESLGRKDRARITSAADKQFVSLDDFRQNAEKVLRREVA